MGRSDKRKPQNEDVYIYIFTILVLQSRQISETAVAVAMKKYFNVRLDG